MSGFADLVRGAVSMADSLTGTLQATVQHYAWSAATRDPYGKVTLPTATARAAIVESLSKLVRNARGELVQARAKVTFLRPVVVDPRDRIVLPDGSTGPILQVNGLDDPATGQNYMTEVLLGG